MASQERVAPHEIPICELFQSWWALRPAQDANAVHGLQLPRSDGFAAWPQATGDARPAHIPGEGANRCPLRPDLESKTPSAQWQRGADHKIVGGLLQANRATGHQTDRKTGYRKHAHVYPAPGQQSGFWHETRQQVPVLVHEEEARPLGNQYKACTHESLKKVLQGIVP